MLARENEKRERESAQGTTERKTSPTGALDCLENTVGKRLRMRRSRRTHSVPRSILFTLRHASPTSPTSYRQKGHHYLTSIMTYPPLHPIPETNISRARCRTRTLTRAQCPSQTRIQILPFELVQKSRRDAQCRAQHI
jgi:hypothetical protein